MSIISELKRTTERSNQIDKDTRAFFESHGQLNIAEHTDRVVENSRMLAAWLGISPELPVTAAYLHDTGSVFPKDQFVPAAIDYGIEVLEEERLFPGLLHQKLSKAIAFDIFGVRNSIVLDAIECHTTLKAGASDIDLLLFVADKLSWPAEDSKPFIDGIHNGLKKTIQHAALSYIIYLIESKDTPVLHPWMLMAHADLRQKCT